MIRELIKQVPAGLKTSLFYITLFVLPVGSLFLIFVYLQPWVQNFLTLPIQTLSLEYLITYITLFTVSSITIGMYFYLTLYHEKSELKFLEKLSYPLVTSLGVLTGYRFLRYYMSAEAHRQLSIFISEFAILLPTLTVAKFSHALLTENHESYIEFLAGIPEPNLGKKEIATNVIIVPIFGLAALIFEKFILNNIPEKIFVLIGPIVIILGIFAISSLRDPEFKSWVQALLQDTSS
jgi:hypothetical protein